MSVPGPRRVVLVGFMASGKSTVGPLLAAKLGWRFVDMDRQVEETEGLSIPDIFALRGEAYFRGVEEQVGEWLLRQDGVVIGSGGGWAAAPGRLAALPEGSVSVWLRVSPAEAVRRARGQAGERPLLKVSDPAEEAHRLLAERERSYAAATLEVDTEAAKPEDVSARILEALLRTYPELRSPNAQ